MKSHASDLIDLAVSIISDAAAKCTTEALDCRDINTLISRVEHEGLSFLTITLPSLGQDFERSLEQGRIGPTFFRAFRKKGKAPAFMQGFFAQVFDIEHGGLLNEPSIEAIEGIRQVAYAFKKLNLPCKPCKVARAIEGFKEIEADLQRPLDQEEINVFNLVSRELWDDMVASIEVTKLIPRHGPGATAERISGNQKFGPTVWHDRLEPYFPLLDYKFTTVNAYDSKEFKDVTIVDENSEQPVRVITVPKTLKAPRIIAIEPVCMQYAQQAVSGALVKALESYSLTSGHVNFTDQSINRSLARSASRTNKLATLDLSAASDRVPCTLALQMFDGNPSLKGAIQACRSTRAQLPTGEILTLRKFASMGSALCFPVEAMYFYTICVVALLKKHNLQPTHRNIHRITRQVYIYGDDMIIPVDAVGAVSDALHKYFCKVNADKSFWIGKFRESCGMDAYDGYEVTPTYVRSMPPRNRRNASEIISLVKTSNLFYRRGYWKTAATIRTMVERVIGTLPIVREDSEALGWFSYQRVYRIDRFNKTLHRPEVRAWVVRPVKRVDKIDGYAALTKSLLILENRSSWPIVGDEKHLERSARHGASALKRRYVSTY